MTDGNNDNVTNTEAFITKKESGERGHEEKWALVKTKVLTHPCDDVAWWSGGETETERREKMLPSLHSTDLPVQRYVSLREIVYNYTTYKCKW